MNEIKIAQTYVPHFKADLEEPFEINAIGYEIFCEGGKSHSCNRTYKIDPNKCKYMIEYAIYYDFDIQHLYDLEHVFVYIGLQDEIIQVEASFHGKFFNAMIEDELEIENQTHPVFYMQPGKHAMMPHPKYFQLLIGADEVCNEMAGSDGFLVAKMFKEYFTKTDTIDREVEDYIKEHYAFVPSGTYEKVEFALELIPYNQLEKVIVERLNRCLQTIEEWKGH